MRPRIFEQLDDLRRRHSTVWISAPPGSGKSTLVATYLSAGNASSVWCQLDSADNDPATLFFYLTEAAVNLKKNPFAIDGISATSPGASIEQSFFRNFYKQLPEGTVLVLDNAQEFDWGIPGSLLECALVEKPDKVDVVIISREPIPGRLIRLQMDSKIGTLQWGDIKFNEDESRALAHPPEALLPEFERWSDVLDGWAAGLTMLRNQLRRSTISSTPLVDSRDGLFEYFAGEIFDRLSPESREILMSLSVLPGVSKDHAQLVTGNERAGELLESLYQRRLFIERRGQDHFTFHFHALFCEFLREQAISQLPDSRLAALRRQAGQLMDQLGRVDEAAQLFQDAHCHDLMLALLLREAPAMNASGRSQTWREWMSALPADMSQNEPWLRYWHGVSLIHLAPLRAREILHLVFNTFDQKNDLRGQIFAITAVIDSYEGEWRELDNLRYWAELLTSVFSKYQLTPHDDVLCLRVHSRLTLGLLLVDPESDRLVDAAMQTLRLVSNVDNPIEKIIAGATLLRYFEWAGADESAQWLVADVSRIAQDATISAFHRAWWFSRVARWYGTDGKWEELHAAVGTAQTIVSNFDLDPLLFQFLQVNHLLGNRNLTAARSMLDDIQGRLKPSRATDWMEFHWLSMQYYSLSGNNLAAIRACKARIAIADELGLSLAQKSRTNSLLAVLYAVVGETELSCQLFDEILHSAYRSDMAVLEEMYKCTQILAFIRQDREEEALLLLRPVLSAASARESTSFQGNIPALAAPLADLALKFNVEPVYTRAFVRRQELCPPNPLAAYWPWPVSIRTFGKFELRLFGDPVVANGKAQQRPLMLLKAISATSQLSKPQKLLGEQLWPDGEDPKSALNITVHRLRKLLQSDDLVIVTAGTVQLAEAKVWTDVQVFVSICDRIDAFQTNSSVSDIEAISNELLDIYRGGFCEGEGESWMIPIAERHRSRFLASASKSAALLEEANHWSTAQRLYLRTLEVETLSEISYRGVMRCAMAQHDVGAAMNAYRQCKKLLSIVVGRQPSLETDRLAKEFGFKT